MAKKKIKLTEQQLKDIIEQSIKQYVSETSDRLNSARIETDIPDVTSENPNLSNERYVERYLNEGLIASYDKDSVKRILCREFNLLDKQVQFDERSDDGDTATLIDVILPRNVDNQTIGRIKQRMRSCGYFCPNDISYHPKYNIAVLLFEPKFSDNVFEKVKLKHRFLFHSTPKKNLNKILKNGIVPCSKNSVYMYPDRIYCMRGDTLSQQQLQVLKNVQTRNNANNGSTDYVLLTIDVDKLPNTTKMYIDPISPETVLTYDNIPPQAIVKYEDFTLC